MMRNIKRNVFKVLLMIGLLGLVAGIGLFQMNKQSEEVRRNREYEVSLVKALKNSYEGIEEIKISDPSYIAIPGSWSCDVEIVFNDGGKISYGISHSLDKNQNYDGVMPGKNDDEINRNWNFLEVRKGLTNDKVKVIYSDHLEGKQ